MTMQNLEATFSPYAAVTLQKQNGGMSTLTKTLP
jgi:hypothetical protein